MAMVQEIAFAPELHAMLVLAMGWMVGRWILNRWIMRTQDQASAMKTKEIEELWDEDEPAPVTKKSQIPASKVTKKKPRKAGANKRKSQTSEPENIVTDQTPEEPQATEDLEDEAAAPEAQVETVEVAEEVVEETAPQKREEDNDVAIDTASATTEEGVSQDEMALSPSSNESNDDNQEQLAAEVSFSMDDKHPITEIAQGKDEESLVEEEEIDVQMPVQQVEAKDLDGFQVVKKEPKGRSARANRHAEEQKKPSDEPRKEAKEVAEVLPEKEQSTPPMSEAADEEQKVSEVPIVPQSTLSPIEKEIMKLEKKLREVEKLTKRLNNGEDLDTNQRAKIVRCEEIIQALLELRAVRDGHVIEAAEQVPVAVDQGFQGGMSDFTGIMDTAASGQVYDWCATNNMDMCATQFIDPSAVYQPYDMSMSGMEMQDPTAMGMPVMAMQEAAPMTMEPMQDFTQGTGNTSYITKKWEVCWEWSKNGCCSKGAECEWEHPEPENENTCWEWSKKKTCSKGNDCPWEHPPVCVGYVTADGTPVDECQMCNQEVFAVFAVPAS